RPCAPLPLGMCSSTYRRDSASRRAVPPLPARPQQVRRTRSSRQDPLSTLESFPERTVDSPQLIQIYNREKSTDVRRRDYEARSGKTSLGNTLMVHMDKYIEATR